MRKLFLLLLITISAFSCKKDDDKEPTTPDPVTPDTGVVFDPTAVPYQTLSEYQFFTGDMKDLEPNNRVLPYSLISSLFTDYAKKKRFIWMPEGLKANYTSDGEIFDFPEGTITIKNFYYDNVLPNLDTRIIETRLIYKKDGEWVFAEYVWNEDQTEAILDMDGSFTPVQWLDENDVEKSADYRIPSEAQCLTCHKVTDDPILIGPKPQNLNMSYEYQTGSMNQLTKWAEMGILDSDYPSSIVSLVDWKDEEESISDRMRSYVDINCAHCHSQDSHCSYRSMRFAFSESMIDENMGICVEPDENIGGSVTHIIASGNRDRSMVYYRLNTTDESERMPLLGRTLIHEEALEMVEQYINSLSPPCQ